MRILITGFLFLIGFCLNPVHATCVHSLRDSLVTNNQAPRKTRRDVRVVSITEAWKEPYNSREFWSFASRVLLRVPRGLEARVDFLLQKLDEYAKLGRLKNLNDWVSNLVRSTDAPALSFIAEAEYAVYVVRQNPHYDVTFEPEGGFYRGHPDDVARIGMRQKSIDLRISDSRTGQVLAMREVKSSARRGSPGENIQDAFEKVRLVHHLKVPELSGPLPVEIGIVYLYDFDPNYESTPRSFRDFYSIKDGTLVFLENLKQNNQLPEHPFDTVTFIDFGSRRVFYIKRMSDDSLEVSDFILPGDAFITFEPKISVPSALELRNYLLNR